MINNNFLEETVPMMLSDNYKERFRAEYYQLFYRYERLKNMVDNWQSLDFEPACDYFMYAEQLKVMREYLDILAERAEAEDVDISMRLG